MTKTKIRCTSLMAFQDILPILQEREMEVLKAVRHLGIANNLMISRFLNLPVNCITGRIFSLRKYGLIIFYKKDKCPYTNKLTIMWKIPEWINSIMVEQ